MRPLPPPNGETVSPASPREAGWALAAVALVVVIAALQVLERLP